MKSLQEAFAWNKGYKEFFAVKATPNPFLIQILKEYGVGCDCSSKTELMLSKAIGASGVVRIDYLLDNKTKEVYANEINTIPGSLAFYLWDASGIKYRELIDKLVEIAFRRERRRENLKFTIDTNILSGVSFGSKGSKGSKF